MAYATIFISPLVLQLTPLSRGSQLEKHYDDLSLGTSKVHTRNVYSRTAAQLFRHTYDRDLSKYR